MYFNIVSIFFHIFVFIIVLLPLFKKSRKLLYNSPIFEYTYFGELLEWSDTGETDWEVNHFIGYLLASFILILLYLLYLIGGILLAGVLALIFPLLILLVPITLIIKRKHKKL